jgi:serine/threonine protein kinase
MVSIPPGSSLGRYRVIQQLGRGGMATVFRCHDPNLDRHVAVKVLPSFHTEDPTFTERFAVEAQTVARLNHPNILQIYDFGEDKGFTYIVSELVPGGDLQDMLDGNPLPIERVIELMGPLANALDHAHSQGIIHRDLKPANVLIGGEGQPILADFGLARMLEGSTRFTQAGQAIGTPEYMAPEQAMGADADHRSDLYAFGILIFQTLLGDTPFRADTPAATLMAHVHQPLPLPSSIDSNIDPRLEANLLKSLAKDPDDRFQSARDMVDALSISAGLAPNTSPRDEGASTQTLDSAPPPQSIDTDAQTAVLGAQTSDDTIVTPVSKGQSPPTAGEQTAVMDPAPVEASAEAPAKRPPIVLIGSIAAVVVAVIAVVVVAMALYGDEETAPEPADSSAAAAVDAVETPAADTKAAVVAVEEPTSTAVPAAPTATPEPAMTLSEALAALEGITTRAEENVVKFRNIAIEAGAVDTQMRTRDQLEAITKGFFRRDALREQVFEAQELYKVLELMDENLDLEDILTEIQLQHVYALFDDESEIVYVLSDATSIGPLEEYAYASAFMGGAQQSLFDIATMRSQARRGGADEFRALSALVSGDVAQIGSAYVSTFTQEQLDILTTPLPDNKLLSAPAVIQKTVLFPQREGGNFVAQLYGNDNAGWEGVDAAYKFPPISTEQVLHPEKYFGQEEPQRTTVPNLSGRLGKGWTQVSSNVMGEFLIRTYLEEYLGEIQAEEAAEGWGGDRYSLLSGPEGERALVSLIKWDSFAESAEFFDAYEVFAGIKLQEDGGTSEDVGESGRKWIFPERTVFLGQLGPVVTLIVADNNDLVGSVLGHLFEALDEIANPP